MLPASITTCASQWQCLSPCMPEETRGCYVEKLQGRAPKTAGVTREETATRMKQNGESPEEVESDDDSPLTRMTIQECVRSSTFFLAAEKIVDAEILDNAVEQSAGAIKVFHDLTALWPLSFFGSFGIAMLAPMFPYISLNFFARQYTDLSVESIHCELDTSLPYCAAANAESTSWQCIIASASAVVQLMFGPLIGAVSDTYGRKKAICIICFLQTIPISCLYFHMSGYLSFWVCLACYPLLGLPFISVYFTIAVDVVADPDERSIAFNLIIIADAVSALGGLIASSQLDLVHVVFMTFGFFTALLLYMAIFLSETLPPTSRRHSAFRDIVPGVSLKVFCKDRAHRQLAFVFFCGLLYKSGFSSLAPCYLQKVQGFPGRQVALFMLTTQVSAIITIGMAMGTVQQCLGDGWTMGLSLLASSGMCFVFVCAHSFEHVISLTFMCSGFTQLLPPVASAMVTRLADEGDQGMMQGALASLQGLSSIVGPAVINMLYQFALSENFDSLPWIVTAIFLIPSTLVTVFVKNPGNRGEVTSSDTRRSSSMRQSLLEFDYGDKGVGIGVGGRKSMMSF